MADTDILNTKIGQLKERVADASSVLIVTHDFPDPDCLGASFGLQTLFQYWGIKNCQITFGGFVGRAENRAMIRFLKIQTVPLMLVEIGDFDRIVLVDSFPGEGNVSLSTHYRVDMVIDHHPHEVPDTGRFLSDIRDYIGATSTMITQYLRAEDCPISPEVATALFYGIKTDTNDLARHVAQEDLECYKFLFNLIDHTVLSKIESPDRDAEYFRILNRSTESMTIYDTSLGHIHLGAISTPDYIAEIADLFHSLENLEWMICSAIFKNQIFFSIRSKTEETAGRFASMIAEKMSGNGGGHANKAAGQIPLHNLSHRDAVERFVDTFKTLFNIHHHQGQSILDK
jgi:nanoRNase/pAp phosphatase (c-di-AMP/oligoRNAs hydrolase)